MTLTVKFIGSLRHVTGKSQLRMDHVNGMSLRDLLVKMSPEAPELKKSLGDMETDDSALNALILVNGMEISVLDGLKTKLSDGDEIVFVPVIHGG